MPGRSRREGSQQSRIATREIDICSAMIPRMRMPVVIAFMSPGGRGQIPPGKVVFWARRACERKGQTRWGGGSDHAAVAVSSSSSR
jgi:hypothetical protein